MFEADTITGNFNGWEYISLIVGLLFFILASILIMTFIKRIKSGMLFSFNTVMRLGFSIFLFVMSYARIKYFFAYGSEGTFYLMLISTLFSARTFMVGTMPVLVIFALALMISNFVLIKHEGFFISNLYAIGFAFLLLTACGISVFLESNQIALSLSNQLMNSWYAIYCYCVCMFFAVQICALIAAKWKIRSEKDYILILGCKIKDDGSLYPIVKGRADKALELFNFQKKTSGKSPVLLPTGGKGDDEHLSEGQAIKNYLLSVGVDEKDIVAETESTTTKENMLFSKKLIDNSSANVAFSTSDFHVFRSGMLAADLGWRMEGIGAKTKWYFWPNAFIREFIALIGATWKYQLIMIALICSFAIITVSML